ncbi:unnamed protein product [Rhizopus microsporus]
MFPRRNTTGIERLMKRHYLKLRMAYGGWRFTQERLLTTSLYIPQSLFDNLAYFFGHCHTKHESDLGEG